MHFNLSPPSLFPGLQGFLFGSALPGTSIMCLPSNPINMFVWEMGTTGERSSAWAAAQALNPMCSRAGELFVSLNLCGSWVGGGDTKFSGRQQS